MSFANFNENQKHHLTIIIVGGYNYYMKLHEAIKNNDIETLKKLLEAGANPNEQDTDGKTAVDILCEKENSIIQLLGAEI